MKPARFSFALLLLPLALSTGRAQTTPLLDEAYIRPPKEIEEVVLAPRFQNVTLSNLSPDRTRFLVPTGAGLPPVELVGKPYVNLAGEMIDTSGNRDRSVNYRSSLGYRMFDWQTGKWSNLATPANVRVGGADWSPDGKMVAFLAHADDGSYLWLADTSTGKSRRLMKSPLLLTLVNSVQWVDGGRKIMAVLVPDSRPPAPVTAGIATQPLVRVTESVKNPQRTYRALLSDVSGQNQFVYYTTGQLALISLDKGTVQKIGKPAIIRSFNPSPNGKYVRVTTVLKPFSYLVPASSFGSVEELWDDQGKVVTEIDKRELKFGETTPPTPRPDAKRSLAWRPDGNGMAFIQQEPTPSRGEGGSGGGEDEQGGRGQRGGGGEGAPQGPPRKDRVMQWLPPYGKDDTKLVYESDARINSVRYSPDCQTLFLTETRAGNEVLYAVKLSDPKKKYTIYSYRPDDFYKNPGTLMMTTNSLGQSVVRLSKEGTHVYLSGTQYSEDPDKNAPRPFIDAKPIGDGEVARVWQSSADVYENDSAVLDEGGIFKLVVQRQSPTMPSNYYLVDLETKQERPLTDNKDYSPQITRAQRYRVLVTRSDGFKFWVKVTTPLNHRKGDKLPAMFWFYPREVTDQKAYDQGNRTYNKNSFPTTGSMSMEYLTLLGYAVIQPDIPIVGPTGRMNDAYVPNLRNSLSAVIDELTDQGIIDRKRLAAGGHSYGAFSTANAMVHTPFFKAGIAGDGNYNRTLTPTAFQSETRMLWDARETYLSMSPMLYADQMTGALLMYHGMDDQNVGTDPINSIRLFHALQALGKTAALYMYPYEDHSPAARETYLDMWGRWVAWLDKYVKNPK
jgi:dipeptidyl aminopeptidase/acylaminoacyl peptidase